MLLRHVLQQEAGLVPCSAERRAFMRDRTGAEEGHGGPGSLLEHRTSARFLQLCVEP